MQTGLAASSAQNSRLNILLRAALVNDNRGCLIFFLTSSVSNLSPDRSWINLSACLKCSSARGEGGKCVSSCYPAHPSLHSIAERFQCFFEKAEFHLNTSRHPFHTQPPTYCIELSIHLSKAVCTSST